MELDAELQKLKEYVDAPKAGIVNLARYRELMASYLIIKQLILAEDPDATIKIVEGALQNGSMVISIVTLDVTVYDMAAFSQAIKYADNFQICPTADDMVSFDILFEGVISYTLS